MPWQSQMGMCIESEAPMAKIGGARAHRCWTLSIGASCACSWTAPWADPPRPRGRAASLGRAGRGAVPAPGGGGGHAGAIAEEHPELRTLIGMDVDPAAHAIARERLLQSATSGAGAHPLDVRQVEVRACDCSSVVPSHKMYAGSMRVTGRTPGPARSLRMVQCFVMDVRCAGPAQANFIGLKDVLREHLGCAAAGSADGILLDVGVSSMQVEWRLQPAL